ncbi:MAG: DNA mismatch repair protein MutS [Labilithrix sp.]|nr:DNA mismatch repair protein MutS [Labilithrix sp.]MCW5815867.1 DNA mismatch repair protein MutS [Labilithrix sp.]
MNGGKTGHGADTPVMKQYLASKAQYPDAILFFRLGDFYELFFEDAVVAARVLDLTLTSRNKNADEPIAMAGVPYHAAAGYIQKLLDQGFKVAIAEQMADPAKTKGIVPREVVRIATPALAYDDSALDARKNLFLMGIDVDERDRVGVAVLDFSTGTLEACEAESAEAAIAEIVRLDPREVLVRAPKLLAEVRASLPRATVREEAADLDLASAIALLDDVLGKGKARKACASDVALRAAARCVALAKICEPGKKLPLAKLAEYTLGDTLVLDDATQRHLELVRTMDGETKGSLLEQIDATKTAPGARLLRRRLLAPRTRVVEIRRRLDGVELFVTQPGLRSDVRARLAKIADVERLAVKLAIDRIGPRELASLRSSLAELPGLDDALKACPDKGAREALEISDDLVGSGGAERVFARRPPAGELERAEPSRTRKAFVDRCEDVHDLLARAIADEPPIRASEGNVFRDGFDAELDEARVLAKDGQRLIVDLETRCREEAQIPSLKLRYTRVFGWYIEVTKSHLAKVPKAWRRKQTIATGERFTCDELDDLADKLAHAEERLSSREAELWSALVKDLAVHDERLRAVANRLATIDVASALAEVAHRDDYTRPEVDDSLALDLVDARHPVVERLAAAGRFVPNDVTLDASPDAAADRSRLWIVTGPNMAGKSTFMRQVALAVVLAHTGSFVPARSARIGVVDRVLTRVGASDNLARGESTFMVEMKETANIVKCATRRSLVVLDEIGRGTSTYDGLSIAWAVAEHLHDVVGCRALFATHYHELTELAETSARAENFSVSAREHAGTIVFFHKVQRGAASRSYGVACARLAGLPENVLARAKAILEGLETTASLPTGGSSRGVRKRKNEDQLGLFAAAPRAPERPADPALDMLRALDIDRLTPIEALTTLAKLKDLAKSE